MTWITTKTLLLFLLCGPSVLLAAKDKEVAILPLENETLAKECQSQNLRSCLRLGYYYDKHNQPELAYKYFLPACEGGDAPSCMALARLEPDQTNLNKIMKWLRKECRSAQSKGEGCYQIALLAKQTQSPENAKTWLRKACAKGHLIACSKK